MSTSIDNRTCEIEVFFDGGCPLCVREIRLLRSWDRKGRIQFTDIDAPSFVATNVGKSQDDLMAQMHGRLSDGTWVTGVDVFRAMYAAVGFGPLVAMSRLPGVSHMLSLGYAIFARNRLWITGRCDSGTCSIRPDATSRPDIT